MQYENDPIHPRGRQKIIIRRRPKA